MNELSLLENIIEANTESSTYIIFIFLGVLALFLLSVLAKFIKVAVFFLITLFITGIWGASSDDMTEEKYQSKAELITKEMKGQLSKENFEVLKKCFINPEYKTTGGSPTAGSSSGVAFVEKNVKEFSLHAVKVCFKQNHLTEKQRKLQEKLKD